ncbi:MAG: cache domain-containing protein [Pseudomonadota bacterium]
MKKISFTSLRSRLILLVLLVIIILMGLSVYRNIDGINKNRFNALDDAGRAAHNASLLYEQTITKTQHIFFTLSQMPKFLQQDTDACSKILASLLKETEIYSGLAAVKPNGEVYASAPFHTKSISFADHPLFQRLVQNRRFVIGEYLIGHLSGKATLVLAYPVIDNTGQLITAFIAGLDLEKIQQMLCEVDLPEGANLSVIDSNGTILIRFPDPEKFVGKKMLAEAVVKTMLTKKEGVMEKVGLDNVPRLFGYTTIGSGIEAIHVGVGIPEQVAYKGIKEHMVREFTLLGLVSMLAFLGAWLLAGRLVISPVNHLIEVTNKLADGDMTVRAGQTDTLGGAWFIGFKF